MLKRNEDGVVVSLKGETEKAKSRRIREGWFEKYAPEDRPGLDIGCNDDPLNWTFRRWDISFGDGDGAELEGVPPETYHTVYASHVLEHIPFHKKAICRWYEVLKPGGHLIICVPHRDLYEKKRFLPSNWNHEHVRFWLPDNEELPCTLCLKKEILSALPNANIVSYRVLDEGYMPQLDEETLKNSIVDAEDHPAGEYSIEAIIQKPQNFVAGRS